MDLQSAHVLALQLLEKYGLYDWNFVFDRAKVRFGSCQYGKKIITLSRHLTEINSDEQVRDTILHEVAHALVGKNHNHDKVWKAKAKEIGCTGKVCYSHEVLMPLRKYTALCTSCDRTFQAQKKNRVACHYCCKKHNRGQYSEEFRIRFVENEK